MRERSPWLVLAVVSSALFLIVVDMTILYTALPRLTRDLGATASEKLWIVNAYSLIVAGLLPGAGALGDRYGHRLLFMIGLAVFGVASLIAGLATTPEMLIAGRVVLAVGAAAMMPATLSIIRHTFEDPSDRAFAIGIWAAVASGGAALGPLIGGAMLERYSWGAVFLINLPAVAIALPLAWACVPERRSRDPHPFDLAGSALALVGLVGVTMAIKEVAKPEPTLAGFAAPAAVGGFALVLFVRRQLRSAAPMIDLALFRDSRFSAGVIGAVAAAAALLGIELVVSQRLQLVSGLSPLEAGLFILPLPLAAFVSGPLAGLFLERVGAGRMLVVSLSLTGAGALIYWGGFERSELSQFAAFAVMGAGLGAGMTAASSAIMMNAPSDRAGMAASMEEVSYEFGGALGIALLGSLMSAAYTATFLAALPDAPEAADSLDRARLVAEGLPAADAARLLDIAVHAFDRSVAVVMLACAGILVLAAAWIARLSRAAVPARTTMPAPASFDGRPGS